MVKKFGVPAHPPAVGVIIIVAKIEVLPTLVAVKAGKLPVPLAPNPMDVLLLVQLKVVPATGPVNTVAGTAAPLQTIIFAGAVTVGTGLTVIVKVVGVPLQEEPTGTL